MQALLIFGFLLWCVLGSSGAEQTQPFGSEFPRLDSLAVGEWWKARPPRTNPPPSMDVSRDQVVAFALYTCENGALKLTAQLFPLKPGEPREARLEFNRHGRWREAGRAPVIYPGWSAHFRVQPWDTARDVRYRVRHGEQAQFEGLIRRDPKQKNEIIVASMSCNSSRTTGDRPEILENLKRQNPDLLFFAGDQTYRHTEHTAGWIEFGLQFRDIIRDRPTITIPDDHDVGHPNLWGEGGAKSLRKDNADGGYFYPVEYVNMVQRQQTWHLPDPVDPEPAQRGIGVYFTRLRVGGVDFAILEDRKFKSAPLKVPTQGPRPDHITDPNYDPASIDLPGLQLLGARQEKFLHDWHQDWRGAQLKAVLSATAFAGAVHLHGARTNRLLADLDCNGWPQSGRARALTELRRARAVHLCGDQHLAVVLKHGIDEWRDGPWSFTSPALVNTIYGRWWEPLEIPEGRAPSSPTNNSALRTPNSELSPGRRTGESPSPSGRGQGEGQTGPSILNPLPKNPLPAIGDFRDGLGNRITMHAYANPADIRDERQRADGFGIARFNKNKRTVTFECWPRFADARAAQRFPLPRGEGTGEGQTSSSVRSEGQARSFNKAQFPGWPIQIQIDDNDGRRPVAWLPELRFRGARDVVVQVINDSTTEILYTIRAPGRTFRPPVFAPGKYTVRVGRDRPESTVLAASEAAPEPRRSGTKIVQF